MNNQISEEQEYLEKLNKTFLYNIGYEHVKNICDEADQLLGEYKDVEVPESLNKWFNVYQEKLKRKKQREDIKRKAIIISKRIAMIFLVISVATSFLTLGVDAFRVRFFNMIIETSQRFSSVSMEENHKAGYISELPEEWSNYY